MPVLACQLCLTLDVVADLMQRIFGSGVVVGAKTGRLGIWLKMVRIFGGLARNEGCHFVSFHDYVI